MGALFSCQWYHDRHNKLTQQQNLITLENQARDLHAQMDKVQSELDALMDKRNAAERANEALGLQIFQAKSNPLSVEGLKFKLRMGRRAVQHMTDRLPTFTIEFEGIMQAQSLVEQELMKARSSGKCDIAKILKDVIAIQNKRRDKLKKTQGTRSKDLAEAEDSLIKNKIGDQVEERDEKLLLSRLDHINRPSDGELNSDVEPDSDLDAYIAQCASKKFSHAVGTASAPTAKEAIEINESASNEAIELEPDMI